jgi:prephenate dehydrogenase
MPRRRPQQIPFKNITIVGVGLIGGSLALAVKQRFPLTRITGVDTPEVLRRALQRKAIDIAERSLPRAVAGADLVVLAAPVNQILRSLPVVAKHCDSRTIVTDTGSVKNAIAAKAQKLFPAKNFIGGHPMTGAEFSGIDAAHPLLFQNAIYIVTPDAGKTGRNTKKLARFFSALDARVVVLDPKVHDKIVAAVSHVPQLAAVALMNMAGRRHAKHLGLAAGGFRDMTRIASSRFDMWQDILETNKKDIAEALDLYIDLLRRTAKDIRRNPKKLKSDFESSRRLRSRIPRSMKGFLSPLVELPVFIDDRPGQLARLTALLAKAKLNVKDIELLKVREGRGGTFLLSFDNRAIAQKAQSILRKGKFETGGVEN